MDGFYELVPDQRGMPLQVNGRPVWGDGEKRLYKSSKGTWMLCRHESEMERNCSCVRSTHAVADQVLPDKVPVDAWEYCLGRPDGRRRAEDGNFEQGAPKWLPCVTRCRPWAHPNPRQNQ